MNVNPILPNGHSRSRRLFLCLLLAAITAVPAEAADQQTDGSAAASVQIVKKPSTEARNQHYVSNRAPLLPSPFVKLPIGSVRPEGWLRKQLQLQADGMNGHLTEISMFCRKEGNAWLAKDGQGHGWWEEVPYWLKGFGDLGYVLGDERIEAETAHWIEAVLASRQDDGWFGPPANRKSARNKTSMEGVNAKGRPDMWPNALMMSVLRSNYEAHGDDRILRHMLAYCHWLQRLPEDDYLVHWVAKRRGIELLRNILWLYNVTGEAWLLDLADKTHRRTNDWTTGISRYHCVDMSECFCEPALYYLRGRDPSLLAAAERNRTIIYDEFGQVPGGMFGGDERSREGYTGPRQAVETCAMVEMMHTCEMMFTQVEGDVRWADRCEDVAFNSYPAAATADMKALRYLTAPNHVVSDSRPKNPDLANGGAMYRMTPHMHRCCQHNHSHGWPYYAEHLWLATPDDGLCAMLYGASKVTAQVADGTEVTLTETTHYPFGDTIGIRVEAEQSVAFPLYLRIPGWCDSPELTVNDKSIEADFRPGHYVRIEREWSTGDAVALRLPMKTQLRTWDGNGGCVSVDRGPLTYSLQIGEKHVSVEPRPAPTSLLAEEGDKALDRWPAWEIHPTTPWNYGLVLADPNPAESIQVQERSWPENDMPWTHEGAPISLATKARRIPAWKLQDNNLAGSMCPSPIASSEPDETVTLLPMGACRLRLSAFPVIAQGSEGRPWIADPPRLRHVLETKAGLRIVASHIHERETLEALVDGILPESSGDRDIPHATFWPKKDTTETIRVEFPAERVVKGIEVYWFDDTGHGGCRVPWATEFRYFEADQWIPTLPSSRVPVGRDKMNHLAIDPVRTTAVELRVTLRPECSGGILELKILGPSETADALGEEETLKPVHRPPAQAMTPAEIKAGLTAHNRALYIKTGWIRDPYIYLAPDGCYYLTGTTPNPGDPREQTDPYNTGLGPESIVGYHMQLWRSPDLIKWESLGSPFSLMDGYWAKKEPQAFQGDDRSYWHLWAPEAHFFQDKWHIVHTTPAPVRGGSNLAVTAGDQIKAPYAFPLRDLSRRRHDPSLFVDDDGTVYLLWANTMIAPLTEDLTGLAAEPVRIDPAGSRPSPDGKPISRIGHEGATLRKIGKKYVHFGTAWSTDQGRKGSYNLYYCTADKILGPYGPRRFAGRFLGHGTPFQDKSGQWWCTAFFNGNAPPLTREQARGADLGDDAQTINEQGVTIVPLDVAADNEGEVWIRAVDPDYANPGPDEVQEF